MDIRLMSHPLQGTLASIPSKSDAHRKLVCAALADRPTKLELSAVSADIEATTHCLQALGAKFHRTGSVLSVTPISHPREHPLLDCGESGSTLRFLLPVAATLCDSVQFIGEGRLPQRPISKLREEMEKHGVAFDSPQLPLTISGRLTAGSYSLPGNVSSQYITGLLLAMPLLEADSTLTLTSHLESAAYVDLTLTALRQFGVRVILWGNRSYGVPGGQRFRSPGNLAVEGDWSNAAFPLAAGALGESKVTVTGLEQSSQQGDRAVLDILEDFGAHVSVEGDAVTVEPGPLRGCTVNVSEIPDLLPVLAVVAAGARGETKFINAARLRLKESDRLASTAALLHALGGEATELPDGLVVRGGPLHGGTVDSFHDHRIAMAAAVAAIRCEGEVIVTDAGAVEKSYPDFFSDYEKLGGEVHVL